jgi:hypothetical protein
MVKEQPAQPKKNGPTVKVLVYSDYLQQAQKEVGQEFSWNRAHELLFEDQMAAGRKFICTASKGGETRFIFAEG